MDMGEAWGEGWEVYEMQKAIRRKNELIDQSAMNASFPRWPLLSNFLPSHKLLLFLQRIVEEISSGGADYQKNPLPPVCLWIKLDYLSFKKASGCFDLQIESLTSHSALDVCVRVFKKWFHIESKRENPAKWRHCFFNLTPSMAHSWFMTFIYCTFTWSAQLWYESA